MADKTLYYVMQPIVLYYYAEFRTLCALLRFRNDP